VSEKNFKLLNDARLHKLIGLMTLEVDDEMTRAYPGKQGGEVEVRETGGATQRLRLDDVVNATSSEVRERFRLAVEGAVGKARAQEIEECIEALDCSEDAGRLGTLLRGNG
jgi:2-methylcitrate dehydratase PrpD